MSISDSKTCPKCHQEKPSSDFNRHKKSCRECRATIQREYVDRNRDGVYARSKAWRDAGGRHAGKCRSYGISPEDYEAMQIAQGGTCAICNNPCVSGRRLAIDHDHVTGKVRGLLCARCNAGIAQFQDNPDLLFAAIEYVRTYA